VKGKLKKRYVFYLVRHGQSEHNEDWWLRKTHSKLDTNLTENGKRSLEDAAKAIDRDLTQETTPREIRNVNLNCFVSDLARTRQTLGEMTTILHRYNVNKYNPIVLPCASEVAKVGVDGECDSTGSFWDKMALENYPSCTLEQLNRTPNCFARWQLYLDFYANKMRGEDANRMRCRDTNMLALAIYVLDFQEDGILLADFMKKPVVNETKPAPSNPPRMFNWFRSNGGTKHRKLKRKRTRRTR